MLQGSAGEMLARHCSPELVRRWLEEGTARPVELWDRMARLGWLGFTLPVEQGGHAASFLDLVLLFEVCGAALVPTLLRTTTAAALTIDAAGTPEQARKYLPAIARGERAATVALAEVEAIHDSARSTSVLEPKGSAFRLSGAKAFVENGADADWLLVAASRTDLGTPRLCWVVVNRDQPGVEATPLRSFAGDPQADVAFNGVEVEPSAVLESMTEKGLSELLDRFTTLLCAEMIGGLGQVLRLTTAYVKERTQFGRPIGSFQAVQHALADVATELEGGRYATYQAAWRLMCGLPATREVSIAKAWVSPAFKRGTLTAHQLHGGMGFVTEYPLYLYSNRAKAYESRFGSVDRHLGRLAAGSWA